MKPRVKKPKLSDDYHALQHAIVRGDQKEIDRLCASVDQEEFIKLDANLNTKYNQMDWKLKQC